MRTLTTQLRLKRLLRLEAELTARLVAPEADRRLGAVVGRRLLEALRDVRAAWAADQSGTAGDLGLLRRHVSRALGALELTASDLMRPGADPAALSTSFREVALPLLFFLRGLEDAGEAGLAVWLAPEPLRHSA